MSERPEHVHGFECAFGSPTCPAFAEPREPERRRAWPPWVVTLVTSMVAALIVGLLAAYALTRS